MVVHLGCNAGTLLLVAAVLAVSDESADDGGWLTQPEDREAHPGPCNIALVDDTMTQNEFIERYAYTEPVVIRGTSKNKMLTKRSTLLEDYGHMAVRLSSANSYSYQKLDTTLLHYCHTHLHPQSLNNLGNETFYFFGDNTRDEWEDLLEVYNKPAYFLPSHFPALSFGIAGPGSGVPFHFHGPGFAETIWGKKRWFMYPPDVKPHFHPNRTTLQWLMEDYPKLKDDHNLLECTLTPGEVVRGSMLKPSRHLCAKSYHFSQANISTKAAPRAMKFVSL